MAENGYISIGKITGVHGLHGNLKVYSYAESTDLFSKGKQILLKGKNGENSVEVRAAKPYKKGVLLSINGVDDINSAETFIGSDILISRSELPELEEDEYYWFEIIGLNVFSSEGDFLGTVRSIFPTGSNDVYVVKKNNRETLIPALESVIVSIDLEERSMVVDLPEGL